MNASVRLVWLCSPRSCVTLHLMWVMGRLG
jgi:hypothetical protein